MFSSIIDSTTGEFTILQVLLCSVVSIALGIVISLVYRYKNKPSRSMMITLSLLPVLVQVVIMMVNGNIGAGLAIAGAFSLVRFRSNPGSAKDICGVFFAMAMGLATGMGYLVFAAVMTVIIGAAYIILMTVHDKGPVSVDRKLKITVPETLNYTDAFDDLFQKYTNRNELEKVKTTNMGSMFELDYRITLKDRKQEKEFIDELRCRNGNLAIVCGLPKESQEL